MEESVDKIYSVAENPWFKLVSGLSSVISFGWVLVTFMHDAKIKWGALSAFILVGSLFIIALIISTRTYRENRIFRGIQHTIHSINKTYKDALSGNFLNERRITNENDALEIQKQELQTVCNHIAGIYTDLIHHPCTVTIKLLQKTAGKKKYCKTYVRSFEKAPRDNDCNFSYTVGAGKNTAFDEASVIGPKNTHPYFQSGDLTKLKLYKNQRENWREFYKSAIVVPIFILCYNPKERKPIRADFGFLCVDTLSRNRLIHAFFVELLSAFADQICNFICLMQGDYKINPKKRRT